MAREIRRHGDTLGPRQHRGLRGRLQTALETESAPSAYAACNRVGSAEMPARLLQVTHGSSPRRVLEISVTLYLCRLAFHP